MEYVRPATEKEVTEINKTLSFGQQFNPHEKYDWYFAQCEECLQMGHAVYAHNYLKDFMIFHIAETGHRKYRYYGFISSTGSYKTNDITSPVLKLINRHESPKNDWW